MIRPPWHTSPIPSHMACLTLNPGPAFGTGTHPSTHLCLRMLLQCAAHYRGCRLLDIGCGSGILSLAALQLGWQSAVGVDIDDQAIAVATHNAELNGLQDRVQFFHGSWNIVTGQFPYITANVYLGPLVEMLQPVTRHLAPDGTILLSGLLASQETAMRTAVQKAGLVVQTRREEEGWVALAVRRASAEEPGALDLIVEKCSELGLTTLVPLYTDRTVVREVPERLPGKMERWQRIAAAAARQCGRRTCLDIQLPMALGDFCGRYRSAPVKLVCWEEERHHGMRQIFEKLTGESPIVVVIGPEGGLTVHEVERAREHGFTTVGLGPYLLRTETAAIVLMGIVRYSLGELEPSGEHD